ncbi:YkgJ family cysteine cluster protein [Oceanobacillus bengalensis]|uniref:YkgJ family cysteine cluster protein n=1 Tax=Oceanobacillus bengalensis TaxID=1435466 RepID=A0A494Z3P6_9BACI|nr:YkgJ family cysteine cluster protein [Oceanobacillus bengalensis]RKQ17149.1 YkgJ family cysteine cluster protein [Oceanobacillus bengalensis]
MKQFLSLEEIQAKCEQIQDNYEIDEDKFYQIIEKWAERDSSVEEKIVSSFRELLAVVSTEMTNMEASVQMDATCRQGCAFCCYFPIIVSEMEAKIMKKAIENFPEERRIAIQDHLSNYYQKHGDRVEEITSLDFNEDNDFKLKYRRSLVPCPLLNPQTNQCMAYEIRPIPCRTYVNYTDPTVCEENLMPKETVSFEFLYEQYMGVLNEFMQYLYEAEDTAFITYPDDMYANDYLVNWLKVL